MSRIEDIAAGVRRLRQDETLMTIINGIKEDAVAVFLNPNSDLERIQEAHQAIQAVGILERKFDALEADERILNEREQ
jgi:hypothetical protein